MACRGTELLDLNWSLNPNPPPKGDPAVPGATVIVHHINGDVLGDILGLLHGLADSVSSQTLCITDDSCCLLDSGFPPQPGKLSRGKLWRNAEYFAKQWKLFLLNGDYWQGALLSIYIACVPYVNSELYHSVVADDMANLWSAESHLECLSLSISLANCVLRSPKLHVLLAWGRLVWTTLL